LGSPGNSLTSLKKTLKRAVFDNFSVILYMILEKEGKDGGKVSGEGWRLLAKAF
jgi:hypothetical protein